jgi:hypothetical protein
MWPNRLDGSARTHHSAKVEASKESVLHTLAASYHDVVCLYVCLALCG